MALLRITTEIATILLYIKDEPKFPILNCSLKNVLRNKPYIATVMLITIYRYFFNKKLLETLLIFNIHLE